MSWTQSISHNWENQDMIIFHMATVLWGFCLNVQFCKKKKIWFWVRVRRVRVNVWAGRDLWTKRAQATAGSDPGDRDRALTCTGARAAGRHWVGGENFRIKIWLRKATRQCSCFWIPMIRYLVGAFPPSFAYYLAPWSSVPCWPWLAAWPRGTQQFSDGFSDLLCSATSAVSPGSSPNPTLRVSPALGMPLRSQTKYTRRLIMAPDVAAHSESAI